MDEGKQEGQDRAASAAYEWSRQAREDLKVLAQRGEPFTADDLIALTGLPNESGPNRNNAVGPLFSWGRRSGLIEPVGYAPTKREIGHSAMLTIWKGTDVA